MFDPRDEADDVTFVLAMAGLFLLGLLSVGTVGLVLVVAMLAAAQPVTLTRPSPAAAVALAAPTPFRLGLPLVAHAPEPTATPTSTATPTPVPTATALPTWTPIPMATAMPVVVAPMWTATPVATWTAVPSATPTWTPEPTATAMPTPTQPQRVEPVPAPSLGLDDPFVCKDGCADAPNPACPIKGNVNSKGEKIYHVPGGRDYNRTDIKQEEGDQWFCSEAEAEAAGFRAPEND